MSDVYAKALEQHNAEKPEQRWAEFRNRMFLGYLTLSVVPSKKHHNLLVTQPDTFGIRPAATAGSVFFYLGVIMFVIVCPLWFFYLSHLDRFKK